MSSELNRLIDESQKAYYAKNLASAEYKKSTDAMKRSQIAVQSASEKVRLLKEELGRQYERMMEDLSERWERCVFIIKYNLARIELLAEEADKEKKAMANCYENAGDAYDNKILTAIDYLEEGRARKVAYQEIQTEIDNLEEEAYETRQETLRITKIILYTQGKEIDALQEKLQKLESYLEIAYSNYEEAKKAKDKAKTNLLKAERKHAFILRLLKNRYNI